MKKERSVMEEIDAARRKVSKLWISDPTALMERLTMTLDRYDKSIKPARVVLSKTKTKKEFDAVDMMRSLREKSGHRSAKGKRAA